MLLTANHETKLGKISLIAHEDILIAAGFHGFETLFNRLDLQDKAKPVSKVKNIPIISDLVLDYFEGTLDAINGINVRQSGAKFSQNIWKVMRKIPAGKTLSYAELAKRAGSASAVRAAGTACGANLIAPVIPCHRILKSNGEIGNYGYGVRLKELLLKHEGAL